MSKDEKIAFELELLQKRFVERLRTHRSELQELYLLICNSPTVENLHSLKSLVHKLAGSGATFGFPEISRRAFRLETFIDEVSRWIEGNVEVGATSLVGNSQNPSAPKRELQSELRSLYENLQNCLLVASPARASEAKNGHKDELQPKESTAPESTRHESLNTNFPRVLIVSCERKYTQLVLELSDTDLCTVETVNSVAEAESHLTHRPVDLIIIDQETVEPNTLDPVHLSRIGKIIARERDNQEKSFATFFVLVTDIHKLNLHARLRLANAGVTHVVSPQQNSEQAQSIVSQAFHSPKREGYRVLIVDDDEQLCEYYQFMLSQKGLWVKTLSNVDNLLVLLKEFRPELIVLDVHLGEISGLEIATIVRQEFQYEFTPIVFLSTDNTAIKKHLAQNKGADDYLIKPLDSEELFTSLLPRLKAARKYSDLAESLRRTAREREEASQKAQAAKNNMANFLATMTHEIRTPLNGILGMAQLLFKTELSFKQTEYLQLLLRAGENLTNLITNVLDYSKMEAGKLELDLRPQTLQSLIEDLKVVFSETARQPQVILLFASDPRLSQTLVFDKARLLQVATNLVANAVKFSRGGVVLFAQSLSFRDTHQLEPGSEKVLFEVVDSGMGMSESQLSNLFVPFLQVHAQDRAQFGGTGLGLSISQNLVRMMGAEIKASAQQGLGSRFCFEIEMQRVPSRLEAEKEFEPGHLLAFEVSSAFPQNQREIVKRFLQISQPGAEIPTDKRSLVKNCEVITISTETDAQNLGPIRKPSNSSSTGLPCVSDSRTRQSAVPRFRGFSDRPLNSKQLLLQHEHGPYTFKDLSSAALSSNSFVAATRLESKGTAGNLDQRQRNTTALAEQSKPFHGIKALVAEDQEINQVFITALLQNLGCKVVLAENGELALKELAKETPDVVFLDCEMPVLDGYRTAQIVRKKLPELPIFALTANSHWDERARCLAAGMNEMISKPISEAAIVRILEAVQLKAKESVSVSRTEEFDELPLLNLEQVNTLVSISESETRTLLTTMLEAWKTVTEDFKNSTKSALLDGDFDALKRVAHRLKGAAGNIGAHRLYAFCEALQRAAVEADIHKCSDYVKRALATLQDSQSELEHHEQKNAKIG